MLGVETIVGAGRERDLVDEATVGDARAFPFDEDVDAQLVGTDCARDPLCQTPSAPNARLVHVHMTE
eukprot:745810-Prymnesium_polylepis.1